MNHVLRGKITKGIRTDPTLSIEGVGADAKATGDAIKVAEERVLSEIDTHKKDLSNPHKVTAEQVGARPDTWMPTAEDVGASPMEYAKKVGNPHNLLDNSDFTNPVNQRGIASGAVITNAYCIDRWKLMNAGQLTFNDGYITISANQAYPVYWRQYFEKLPKFPVTVRLETTSGIITATLASTGSFTFNDDMYVAIDTAKFVGLYIPQGKSISIVNIALYEGEYTAETLPEYQPKGYGAELAECQRYYYQSWDASNWNGTDITTNAIPGFLTRRAFQTSRLDGVEFPVSMRVAPTVVFYTTRGVENTVGEYSDATKTVGGVFAAYHNSKALVPAINTSGFTVGTIYAFHYKASADL